MAPPATLPPTTTSPTAIAEELTAIPTRLGANYVLQLPRENAVPAGWAMDRRPDYRVPDRQPGDTYRFACLDLPARSIGTASVGYRSLDGLPSVFIEYVVYDSAETAQAALADMQRAAESCPTFDIGTGASATAAQMAMIDFQQFGEASFAAALATDNETNGQLTTHLLKVRQDQIIVGINYANYTADAPPDNDLIAALAAIAIGNLTDQVNEY